MDSVLHLTRLQRSFFVSAVIAMGCFPACKGKRDPDVAAPDPVLDQVVEFGASELPCEEVLHEFLSVLAKEKMEIPGITIHSPEEFESTLVRIESKRWSVRSLLQKLSSATGISYQYYPGRVIFGDPKPRVDPGSEDGDVVEWFN